MNVDMNAQDNCVSLLLSSIEAHMLSDVIDNFQNLASSGAYQGVFDVNVICAFCNDLSTEIDK